MADVSTLVRYSKVVFSVRLLVAMILVTAASTLADDGAGRKARLLYMKSGEKGPVAKELAECDKLTIERYRKNGVEVIEGSMGSVEEWVRTDGKAYAKAAENFQQLAFAKSVKADAIGGLSVWEVSEEAAEKYDMQAGNFIHGWGLSLSGCSSNFAIDMQNGTKVAAIPLKLGGYASEDPWAVPLSVTPTVHAPQNLLPVDHPMRGKPFLGVSLDGRSVLSVTASSPAKEAGLQKGDEIVALDGKAINAAGDVTEALEDRKPGDLVAFEFVHDGETIKKTVALADRYELLEVKLSPLGKPLPDLVGKDIDGKEVRLRDLRGKVVLIDFWATWCGPCVEEMPLVQLLWERAKDKNFVWIGISADSDEKAWEDFVRNNHLGGVQLCSMDWVEAMNISAYPTILLVDTAGVVQAELRGESIAQATLAMLGR